MYNFINSINTVDRFRRGFFGRLDRSGEPTFLTFSIDFKINESRFEESIGLHQSPLFNTDNNEAASSTYSALNYLLRKQLIPEAARLQKFIEVMRYVSENEPWYFQSIAGLDKLWAAETTMSQNFKGKDLILDIETLESIDLRITYLADLYRKAIYDSVYMRELVPENLRYFMMDIYVSEFRDLRTLTETAIFNNIVKDETATRMATKGLNLIKGASDYFINNASFLKFECRFCEFDFSETIPVKDVNIYDGGMAKNKFKVKIGNFFEKHSYRYFDIMTSENYTKHGTGEQFKIDRPLRFDDLVGLGVTLLQAGNALQAGMADIQSSSFINKLSNGTIGGNNNFSSSGGATIRGRR